MDVSGKNTIFASRNLRDGNSVTLNSGDRSVLYLGSDNQLYWPSADNMTIKSFRAYFQLNGIEAGDITNGARLFFDEDDDATRLMDNGKLIIDNETGVWYDLSGRRISVPSVSSAASVLSKGVYIYRGHKRVIK